MKKEIKIEEIGKIVGIFGPVIKIEGLPFAEMQEILESDGKKMVVFQVKREFSQSTLLYQDVVYALSLEKEGEIKVGREVKRTKEVLKIPVGEEFLGKIIDPLGRDVETKTLIETKEKREIERVPPEFIERERVKRPLETGIKLVDALFPIGKGQRELILGDRKTGKTMLALDAILNQKDAISIYTAIGQKQSQIVETIEILRRYGDIGKTILVSASSSDSPVFQYLAPFSAMTIAEYFRDKGKDVLIVFDDLTKHSWAWRELCLLLEMPVGREAYPGDIFYLHARLLERAAQMKKEKGGGSITALPICETVEGDITGYVSTNLISITDGQIYLEKDLFQKGQIPAINIGLSVSRVGSDAQRKCLKETTKGLKLILSQHRELKKLLQLETKISEESQKRFRRGEILLEIFKQKRHNLIDAGSQSLLYGAITEGYLDEIEIEKIKEFEGLFYEFLSTHPEIKEEVLKSGWTETVKKKLKELIGEVIR